MRARAVVGLLAGASLLTAAASAQAYGTIGLAGAALEHQPRGLAASSTPASCPAGVPVQRLTVLNGANVRASVLRKVGNAIVAQSLQLRAAWGTPCVQFGPGGWVVYLQTGYEPEPGGDTGFALGGEHYGAGYEGPAWQGQSYAVVRTGALPYTSWSYAFSHEVTEMLVDPSDQTRWRLGLREVCDPVENLTYQLAGVSVSDFVLPSYFAGGPGPWDEMGALTAGGLRSL